VNKLDSTKDSEGKEAFHNYAHVETGENRDGFSRLASYTSAGRRSTDTVFGREEVYYSPLTVGRQ
jgi:hypothetical protein